MRLPLYSLLVLLTLTANSYADGIRAYAFGGFGRVWSSGMAELCNRIHAENIPCTAHNWQDSDEVYQSARKAVQRGERVVLIGHSLGADSALEVSTRLGGAALVVAFDATRYGPLAAKAGRLIAVYSEGWAPRVERAVPVFCKGDKRDCSHTGIDDDRHIQARVLNEVRGLRAEAGL